MPQNQCPDAEALLNTAITHHRAGRFPEAGAFYDAVLGLAPENGAVMHLSGLVAAQSGRWDDAIHRYERALVLSPDAPETLNNLGVALQARGRLDEAIQRFRQALSASPENPHALDNLGVALQAQGRLADAVACYRQALSLQPNRPETLTHLGSALQALGGLDGAAACYIEALRLEPDHLAALNNLGNALSLQGKLKEALLCYASALRLRPDLPEALNNLAVTLQALGRHREAIERYEQALALRPDYAAALDNLGTAHQAEGRLDHAIACYERALGLQPDNPDTLNALGAALLARGDLTQAIDRCEQALRLKPDFAEAHLTIGLVQLVRGDFLAGWDNYEWRWQAAKFKGGARAYALPRWDGGPVPAGKLLVWAEQGIGDEIMFAGLVPELVRRGLDIVLDCDPRLGPLFCRSFPDVTVLARNDARDAAVPPELGVTVQTPAGSLPRHLRTGAEDFRHTMPAYLVADAVTRDRFRSRYHAPDRDLDLDRDRPLVVGLAWHTANVVSGRLRSLTLPTLAPLLAVPGIRWISLQYGAPDDLTAQATTAGVDIVIDREIDQMADLDGFASQIAALDLVITIDNSTGHLAAALGMPTWMLLPYVPDWRWQLQRPDSPHPDSPWYPTLRLFRQPALGDWRSVIGDVITALGRRLNRS